jgi:eukaryotic-like serine/threonine-protein kinase
MILHRDLKPANIKVTPDGRVKVLDFGLAKLVESSSVDGPGLSNSPTTLMSGTLGGAILGTTGYMSPEQARGQQVDRTSDVWAFGCVSQESPYSLLKDLGAQAAVLSSPSVRGP